MDTVIFQPHVTGNASTVVGTLNYSYFLFDSSGDVTPVSGTTYLEGAVSGGATPKPSPSPSVAPVACLPSDPGDPGQATPTPSADIVNGIVHVRPHITPSDILGICRKLWAGVHSELSPPQVYPLVFNEEHFVKQHLVGVVNSPLVSVETAIAIYINALAVADTNFPEDIPSVGQQYTIPFNDEGTEINLTFRLYFVQGGSKTVAGPYLSVGTVFVK